MARIQNDQAAATVQFLATKFTGADLYEFMADVLDQTYRLVLQQATATARLAQAQLAFERQEPQQEFIRGDYYAAPDGTERRGLTGSTRLQADIVQLDQYALLSDRRKLQLTRSLSLSQLAPLEFAQFRESGVLIFSTPEALFDRDFPGHYLRLIKRVRTSHSCARASEPRACERRSAPEDQSHGCRW